MLTLKVIVLSCLVSLSVQLGKSDRKVVVEEDEPEEDHHDEQLTSSLRFPPDSISKDAILKGHNFVEKRTDRHFTGSALAYITPWNSKGYDLAKSTAPLLTHVAPVWLQVKPQTADHSYSCRIEGAHDIDHGWMEALREANPSLKIVPRVLFEGWSGEEIFKMISHEQWSNRCLFDIMNFFTRNQFDGIVIEMWMDVMMRSRGEASEMLVEFLSKWGDAFHEKHMELIVPVGPPVDNNNQLTGIFTPSHLHALAAHVDYIQLMTYDYPSQDASAVAPYDWVEGSIETLLDGSTMLAEKLLIGLNHYGYQYASKGMEAVKDDQYLRLLQHDDAELEWDAIGKEHYVTTGGSKTYYPSLTSLELRIKLAEKYTVGIAMWEYGQGLDYFSQLL